MKVKSESEVAQLCPTLATPWTAAYQAPSMGFYRQKYWSGVPLPSPHYPDKLSQLAGDVRDSGQGLEAEGMQIFLERVNWADPYLFPLL